MSQHEFDAFATKVRDQMRALVSQVVTPISASLDLEHGTALGTGNYVAFHNLAYLVTNAHIARERAKGYYLAHLPVWNDNYHRCTNPMSAAHWPVDVAIMRLDVAPTSPGRKVLAPSRLARRFSPVDGELLFWLGYPGSTAGRHDPLTPTNVRHSYYGFLHTVGVPIVTQQWRGPLPTLRGFDDNYHVALHYPAAAAEHAGQSLVDVPNPSGMSGSLVWDTKFLACAQAGEIWMPDRAEVCGLLWSAHSNPEVAVATKIEYVRASVLYMLRQESAYFHWVDRGRPHWDDLVDWRWAEENISHLT